MATIGNSFLNLIDVHRTTPEGAVLEVLAQTNPVLDDAWVIPCNNGNKHRHSIRTGLPSVSWGELYKGIPQSKGHTQSVEDTTGFVEQLSSVDERALEVEADKVNQLRLNEASGVLEAMSQEASTGIFYHDTATAPEKMKGLFARYNSLSNPNVVSAGGSGSDNTSIAFVTWGDRFTSLIHPADAPAGLTRRDNGRQRVLDESNNPYYVLEEQFRWHLGMSVGDWRYNARVANIDISELRAGNVDIYKFLRTAYYRLQSRRVARPGANLPDGEAAPRQAIYMNRDVLEALEAIAQNKGSSDNFVRLTPMEIAGQEVMTYRGIPIRETDALLNTEAAVA